MEEDTVLDSDLVLQKKEVIFNALQWWEARRLGYNIVLIACEIFLILYFWKGTLLYGIENAFLGSVLYTIAANVFFSVGWGIEILALYYFGENRFLRKFRIPFFILGVLFSILLTLDMYDNVLYYYQNSY